MALSVRFVIKNLRVAHSKLYVACDISEAFAAGLKVTFGFQTTVGIDLSLMYGQDDSDN